MNDIFKWIINTFEEVGLGIKIIIILFIILILFTMLKPFILDFFKLINGILRNIKNVFKKSKKELKKDDEDDEYDIAKTKYDIIEDVKNHNLMNEIKIIKTKITTMNFGSKKRNKVFRLILLTQMNNVKKHVFKLIETYNVDELDNNKFKKIIFDMLFEIINDTNNQLKIELGNEIYDLVLLDPVKGIRNWAKNNDDSTYILIDQFCSLNYIKYNHNRLYFILTSISTSLSVIFNGIEKRFSDFNGDLDDLINKIN